MRDFFFARLWMPPSQAKTETLRLTDLDHHRGGEPPLPVRDLHEPDVLPVGEQDVRPAVGCKMKREPILKSLITFFKGRVRDNKELVQVSRCRSRSRFLSRSLLSSRDELETIKSCFKFRDIRQEAEAGS